MGRGEILTRSKTLSTRFKNFIDALPDLLLIQILCRLPFLSSVQCKLVFKHWFTIISEIYFVQRFLSIQRELHRPLSDALLVIKKFRYVFLQKLSARKLLLLPPCCDECPKNGGLEYEEKNDYGQISGPSRGVVVGTYNDLVLCCTKSENQRDYFICNPYTKQCVALPPATHVFRKVQVGFICEPYYKAQQTIKADYLVNPDFKCRVVQLLPNFHLEIFCSETGEWKVSRNPEVGEICFKVSQIVAFKGMLCWLGTKVIKPGRNPSRRFTFVLNVFSCPISHGFDTSEICQLIEGPNLYDDIDWVNDDPFLGSGGGRLYATKPMYHIHSHHDLQIWELREDEEEKASNGGILKLKWHLIIDGVSLQNMIRNSTDPFFLQLCEWEIKSVLGFSPTNEDIMYFYMNPRIVICNLRERTLEMLEFPKSLEPHPLLTGAKVFPFMLPWWPTPVPRALQSKVTHYNQQVLKETPNTTRKRRTVKIN